MEVDVEKVFRTAGWDKFVGLNVAVYPSLVRQFYCNFEALESYRARTKVKGKMVNVTVEKLAKIIGAPNDGIEAYSFHKWPKIPEFDPKEAAKFVYEDPHVKNFTLPPDSKLSVERQFLHRIITQSILPRLTKHFKVSYIDCTIMYMLLKEWKLNLPWLVFTVMKHTASRNKGFLPYGHIITLLLEGIELEGEEKCEWKDSNLGKKGLSKMGLKKKKGIFLRESAEESSSDRDEDEDKDEEEEESSSSSSEKEGASPNQAGLSQGAASVPQDAHIHPPQSSTSSYLTIILSAISKHDASIHHRLDNFSTRLIKIEEAMSKLIKK